MKEQENVITTHAVQENRQDVREHIHELKRERENFKRESEQKCLSVTSDMKRCMPEDARAGRFQSAVTIDISRAVSW